MGDTAGRLASRTVLVVDDQPEVRDILSSALRDAGARVYSAGNGEEALDLAALSRPDVVLLDLYMPGMDGWQFIEGLRAGARRATPPVVLQTSADDYGSVERARKMGVAAYVSKPFRLNEVVETCARVVEGARPLQGRPQVPRDEPMVWVSGPDGASLARGALLELAADGAQVDLDSALPLGRTFRFALDSEQQGKSEFVGEVRWVRAAAGRWLHGLLIRA